MKQYIKLRWQKDMNMRELSGLYDQLLEQMNKNKMLYIVEYGSKDHPPALSAAGTKLLQNEQKLISVVNTVRLCNHKLLGTGNSVDTMLLLDRLTADPDNQINPDDLKKWLLSDWESESEMISCILSLLDPRLYDILGRQPKNSELLSVLKVILEYQKQTSVTLIETDMKLWEQVFGSLFGQEYCSQTLWGTYVRPASSGMFGMSQYSILGFFPSAQEELHRKILVALQDRAVVALKSENQGAAAYYWTPVDLLNPPAAAFRNKNTLRRFVSSDVHVPLDDLVLVDLPKNNNWRSL